MYVQLFFNAIVEGLVLSLVAVGFGLIFNTTKVFHLAHGAVYVCGAYVLTECLGILHFGNSILSWIAAFILSIIVIILISWLMEWLVYQPMVKKKSGQAITLIASIGIYFFLVNLIALFFGNNTIILNPQWEKSISWGVIILAPIQIIKFGVAIVLLGILLFFSRSRWFLQVRAIASEETVASVIGVNAKAIRLWAMAVGGGLTAIASMLDLYDTGMDPHRGLSITLSAAVAVIIGGQGSIIGTIIASLIIAVIQTCTEWFISAQWKEGITFLLLIIVILWRTEGIISFKMRLEEK